MNKKNEIQERLRDKISPYVEIDEFILSYKAKLAENGMRKKELVNEILDEAIDNCNAFDDVDLRHTPIYNLNLAMNNQASKRCVVDLVAIVSRKNKESTFRHINEDGEKKFLNYFTIVMANGDSIVESMPIFNDQLRQLINRYTKVVQKMSVRGFFVYAPKKDGTYETYFYVLGLSEYKGSYSAYDFSPDEIKYASKLIAENEGNLIPFLYKNIVRLFNIKNLKENLQLKTCLKNAILQSLSSNEIERCNGLIHSIIWGPPSTGKNLIIKIIELLNLEFSEGQSGKISTAGLLGACNSKDGKYISEPGLLVLAQNGVFVIQDFHSVEENKKKLIFGILSKLMQEGFVIDSTAAKTTFKTPTGIHIDANKLTQIRPSDKDEEISTFEDFGIEMQILTRFDFVMDMKVDVHTRYKTARESLSNNGRLCEIKNPERILKLIIAILKERYPIIEISDEVILDAQKRIDEFYNDNKLLFEKVPFLIDFPQRMMMSVKKYLHAIVRLNCRSYAMVKDVDTAMEFLSPKLEFLKNYSPDLQSDAMLGKGQKTKVCHKYIVEYFKDKPFSISDVIDAMKESDDLTVSRNISERTVRRYVEAVAFQVKRDSWKINKLILRK